MNKIRGVVVAVLLTIWCFPALSSAKSFAASDPKPLPLRMTGAASEPTTAPKSTEAANLAAREQEAPNLQDFRGGRVVIYIGSGVLLVALVVVLLIVLI